MAFRGVWGERLLNMEHFLKDEPESSYQKLLVRAWLVTYSFQVICPPWSIPGLHNTWDSRGGGVDELSSTRHRTSTCQETIDRVLGRTEKAVNWISPHSSVFYLAGVPDLSLLLVEPAVPCSLFLVCPLFMWEVIFHSDKEHGFWSQTLWSCVSHLSSASLDLLSKKWAKWECLFQRVV